MPTLKNSEPPTYYLPWFELPVIYFVKITLNDFRYIKIHIKRKDYFISTITLPDLLYLYKKNKEKFFFFVHVCLKKV